MIEKKRGRPPIDPDDRKDIILKVRVTDKERKQIENYAAEDECTISDYIRNNILKED